MKYLLIIVSVFLFLQYQKRVDKNQTFSDWLSALWSLINPASNKGDSNYLNIAIFSKQMGII